MSKSTKERLRYGWKNLPATTNSGKGEIQILISCRLAFRMESLFQPTSKYVKCILYRGYYFRQWKNTKDRLNSSLMEGNKRKEEQINDPMRVNWGKLIPTYLHEEPLCFRSLASSYTLKSSILSSIYLHITQAGKMRCFGCQKRYNQIKRSVERTICGLPVPDRSAGGRTERVVSSPAGFSSPVDPEKG